MSSKLCKVSQVILLSLTDKVLERQVNVFSISIIGGKMVDHLSSKQGRKEENHQIQSFLTEDETI